ncbi:MAG: LTA synthase family protein [Saccharofermentans sp.]|nr:LTA synthase family protein [Saccharofermentans sp.]
MPSVKLKNNSVYCRITPFIAPISILYYEVVFGLSVYGAPFGKSLGHVLLAAIYFGLPIGIIATFMRKKVASIFTLLMTIVMALPFLVEYFIYKQFKELYDINTILNAHSDALTGFTSTIIDLMLSPQGLLRIVLFMLPAIIILVLIIIGKFNEPTHDRWYRGLIVLVFIGALILNMALIRYIPSAYNAYKTEYSFQNAEAKFGLLETLSIDLRNRNNSSEVEFVTNEDVMSQAELEALLAQTNPTSAPTPTPIPAPVEPGATPAPTPSPTPSPKSQTMNINFATLAANSTGTIHNLNEYCAGLTPYMTNEYTGLFEGKNLILITAEAFTAEAVDPELTPTLYRMATRGINFNDFYVPATAGTTGGEFSNIFGMLPVDGGSSVPHMTSRGNTYFNMGAALNREGYYGIAYHNNDYTYYSRNVTHNKLGYSEGFVGYGNGLEDYINPVWPESDLEMFKATVPTYIDKAPFNVYYMTVSGHSNYSRGANAQSRAHWDETESMAETSSERVRAYMAANIELDLSMEYLINELEAAGIADDTVIVICADHFPYGLDNDAPPGHMPYLSELYGYDVTNYIERDHNRLIIWSGCLEDSDPIVVDSPVSSIDILPTLLNLFGCKYDSRLLPGRDVFSSAMALYFNLNYDWKTDLGTYISSRSEFIPVNDSVEIPDGYVEAVRAIVSGKITYMRGVLSSGYYNYLFGVNEGTEAAVASP